MFKIKFSVCSISLGYLPAAFLAIVVIMFATSLKFTVFVTCVVARVVVAAITAMIAACIGVGLGVRVRAMSVSVVWVPQVTRSGFRVPGTFPMAMGSGVILAAR